MQVQGKVTNVYIENSGSELAVDEPLGSLALVVIDAYDFSELGGTLELNGVQMAYTAVDYDTDTVTLAAPSTVAGLAGDDVFVIPRGEQKWAMVELDDDDEGLRAMVQFTMFDRFDDGIRDPGTEERVLCDDNEGRWVIRSVDEEIPTVDGSYVDPSTLPPPDITPTAPPGSSPVIEATGNAASIVLRAGNVEIGTSIKYYGSTVAGFTPGPTNLIAESQATVFVVNSLTNDPVGDPLLPDTPYYFCAIATNVVGDAPLASPEVSDTLHTDVLAETVMAELVAGFILAGKIQVGQAYIDANAGIVVPQPDGGTISFPVDGSFAQITAKLIARSLNVTDNLTINGTNNQVFGQVTLGEGIVKPQTPPTLSSVHKTWHAFDVLGSNVMQGMMEDPNDSNNWIFPFAFFGTGVRSITKSGFIWNGDFTITGIPSAISDFQPFGGMVYAATPNRYVMLGTAAAAGGGVAWHFVSFSRSGTTLTYSARLEINSGSVFPNQPRMAWDAAANQGYLFYMNSNDDNKMRYLTFQVTSGAITRDPGAIFSNTALPNKYNLGGAYIGNADFGAKRFVIALKGSSQTVWSGTPGSATRQTNEEWTRPFNIMGLHWDGTRFWSFSDNGDIGKHSTNKAPAGRNTVPIQARHTWFDGNGTTHETDGGPIETHDLGNRQWLRVESAPAPDTGGDPLDTEKADQIRVYISSDGVTTPRLQTADGWAAVTPNPTAWKPKVRNVTVATTSGSNQITAAAVDTFVPDDQTGAITGTGIPAGTTITSVDANGKVATLSANATASGSITATVTPAIATRSGVFESINNSNSAPPAVNGFATVGRAPGAYKSTRTDANGPLINFKGDGSGRVGPWQFDNSGKTLNDFGAERPGTIFMWPSTSTPLDCISCQGQAVKRPTMVGGNGAAGNALANNAAADVAPYIRIWQLFGTTFGSGDGSTTFNVPDMRDRFPSGAGTTRALASTGGSDTVTMPDHNHFAGTYSVGTPSGGVTRGTGSSDTAGPSHSHGFSGQSGTVVGANPPINNVPKFLGLNFVMKL